MSLRSAGPVPSVPVLTLSGDAAEAWVRHAVAALRAGRLNTHFPEARALAAHVHALSPSVHRGLYPDLELDRRTGLPSYKMWTRVQTDAAVAEDALARLPPLADLKRKAAADPGSIHGKQLLKHLYYGALKGRPLARLGEMDVALRRVDPGTRTAWFHVVFDKLDASGVFVRYSIDLAQQASAFDRPMVQLSAETARHTEEFRSLIYRFSSLDAEATFAKLSVLAGLRVEKVVKGTVGPWWRRGVDLPEGQDALSEVVYGPAAEGLVASFSLDMAACDLSEDRANDPLRRSLSASLSAEARAGYERARQQLGYKVFADRKLASPAAAVAPLRALCEAAGTRNIIYAYRA